MKTPALLPGLLTLLALSQPCAHGGAADPGAGGMKPRLSDHVRQLAAAIGERNLQRPERLDAAALYLEHELAALGYQPHRQPYRVGNVEVRNIEVELRGTGLPDEIVVIGAHYDSVPGSPGANDNASGVAALLELARSFAGRPQRRTVRLVAFVNEEMPFFGTDDMGSRRYVARCKERGEQVVTMLSLETMAYYSDAPGSQRYPYGFLKWLYPDTGNFLAFVGNLASRALVRRAARVFRGATPLPAEAAALPGNLEGVYWSDQWSFWREGYPAVMVTDTALHRYPHYHQASDTPDKLDYERFAMAVQGLVAVARDLANGP